MPARGIGSWRSNRPPRLLPCASFSTNNNEAEFGDGQAYRCGGEEFAIVFRNTSAKDAFVHLDALRQTIERSSFYVRGADRREERRAAKNAEPGNDRRATAPDRRKPSRKKAATPKPPQLPDHLSVTVSIGVAEPSTRYRQPEQVIQSADQALYRAKDKGRNRVELAAPVQLQLAFGKRAKAK